MSAGPVSAMNARVIAEGAAGELARFERDVLHLIIERPFAPGAPFDLSVELSDGHVALRAKTIGSTRRSDGRFDVRARPIDLRRTDRARLEALGARAE